MGACIGIRSIAAASVLILCVACAQPRTRTIETQIPIYMRAPPPPELLAPITTPLPQFTAAKDGVVGLDEPNAVRLTQLLQELTARLRAWREWATVKTQ